MPVEQTLDELSIVQDLFQQSRRTSRFDSYCQLHCVLQTVVEAVVVVAGEFKAFFEERILLGKGHQGWVIAPLEYLHHLRELLAHQLQRFLPGPPMPLQVAQEQARVLANLYLEGPPLFQALQLRSWVSGRRQSLEHLQVPVCNVAPLVFIYFK